VHAALLEAMQERAVTIAEMTYPLPEIFFVIATQNPIEQEGTYRLPEAELDRFMMKCIITYPSLEEENDIMQRETKVSIPAITPLALSSSDILRMRQTIQERVYIDQNIYRYIADIVRATRPSSTSPFIRYDMVDPERIEKDLTA
jgi:MoxR-like ATPase